jgi:hypothetical protein
MQLLLVVADTGLHQHLRDLVLQLDVLPDQRLPVAQGAPALPISIGAMQHSGRKSQRRQSAILPASMRSFFFFFFFATAMARSISG